MNEAAGFSRQEAVRVHRPFDDPIGNPIPAAVKPVDRTCDACEEAMAKASFWYPVTQTPEDIPSSFEARYMPSGPVGGGGTVTVENVWGYYWGDRV